MRGADRSARSPPVGQRLFNPPFARQSTGASVDVRTQGADDRHQLALAGDDAAHVEAVWTMNRRPCGWCCRQLPPHGDGGSDPGRRARGGGCHDPRRPGDVRAPRVRRAVPRARPRSPKLCTTGYRFVKYYRDDPADRRKGPLHPYPADRRSARRRLNGGAPRHGRGAAGRRPGELRHVGDRSPGEVSSCGSRSPSIHVLGHIVRHGDDRVRAGPNGGQVPGLAGGARSRPWRSSSALGSGVASLAVGTAPGRSATATGTAVARCRPHQTRGPNVEVAPARTLEPRCFVGGFSAPR